MEEIDDIKCPFVAMLKKRELELEEKKHRLRCPFVDIPSCAAHNCVYLNEFNECDPIDINPGNGDAWCNEMIYKGMKEK